MQKAHSISYQPLAMPPPPQSSSSRHSKHPSTNAMPHWLSRSPNLQNSSTSYIASKSLKLSELKVVRSIDLISGSRSRTLGSGATIVRTPDEALRDMGVRVKYPVDQESTSKLSSESHENDKPEKPVKSKHRRGPSKQLMLSPPISPPLPPLPLPEEDEEKQLEGETIIATPRPNRFIPPAPELHRSPSRRSSMKFPKALSITHSNSSSEEPPSVPPLPAHIAAFTQPPPFSPILVSEPSSLMVNRSKVIVTLETSTQTYRTTLPTLTSRLSHLSNYLLALYRRPDAASALSSMYSNESEDAALYRQHLTSQGLVPPSANIHIFLDRPSAPYVFFFFSYEIIYSHHIFRYAHILAYLRQPVLEGQPETLPYSLQFHNFTPSPTLLQSRLEMLIEVRDEAAYINLEALQKLCADEIRQRYGPRQHNHQRGNSTSSVPSIQNINASVYGLHTLSERAEPDFRNSPNASPIPLANSSQDPTAWTSHSTTQAAIPASSPVFIPTGPVAPPQAAIAIRRSKQANQTSAMADSVVARTPPTPQSWDGPDQGRSQSRSSSRSRPTNATPPQSGWI